LTGFAGTYAVVLAQGGCSNAETRCSIKALTRKGRSVLLDVVFQLYQLHKSIGITVMILIALRIVWRLTHRAPGLPADMKGFERVAAHLTHAALYGLQTLMPLSGWAMVSVSVLGIPTVLYGTIPWPDLPVLSTLQDKPPVEATLKVVHHWGGWFLLALIGLHVAAALRHHFFLNDHVLRQMLPAIGRKSGSRHGD